MAKSKSANISIGLLRKKFSSKTLPPCFVINSTEKSLMDELLELAGKSFIGDAYNPDEHVKTFFTDDKNTEVVLSECSNISFFVERKIILLKIVRKPGYRGFTKQENESFSNYIKTNNPDSLLIIADSNEEFKNSQYSDLQDAGAEVYSITSLSSEDVFEWVKGSFGDYEILEEDIKYFCSFLNLSIDQAKEEVEKIKTFCLDTKKITRGDINICIGVSKDFSEFDFVKSVLTKNFGASYNIFKSISLKKDFAIYATYLLSSAFIAIAKIKSPSASNMNPFELRMALKIWSDTDRFISLYKNAANELNELKLKNAIDYIYNAELKLKSGDPDKELLISKLINDLVKL